MMDNLNTSWSLSDQVAALWIRAGSLADASKEGIGADRKVVNHDLHETTFLIFGKLRDVELSLSRILQSGIKEYPVTLKIIDTDIETLDETLTSLETMYLQQATARP